MTMGTARPFLMACGIGLAAIARALADDCTPCAVGPQRLPRRCGVNGGIVVFNSVPPNVPAYWTLFADARGTESLDRLDGALAAWSDVVHPGVPGFPGRLDGEVYVGTSGRFAGAVTRRRVRGVATYPDGSRCEFRLRLAFGLRRDRFSCSSPTGETIAEGRVDVQGMRLRGCRRRG